MTSEPAMSTTDKILRFGPLSPFGFAQDKRRASSDPVAQGFIPCEFAGRETTPVILSLPTAGRLRMTSKARMRPTSEKWTRAEQWMLQRSARGW